MRDSGRSVYRRTVLGTSATAVGSFSGCADTGSTPTATTTTAEPAQLTPIEGGERPTDFLDQVYFGNADSEGDRVTVENAPVVEGGLGVPARAVGSEDGTLAVDLVCGPDEEILLTARLWAGEPSATHLQFAVEGEPVKTTVRVREPRLGDRFFYVTVAIPEALTDGKETVSVELTAGGDSPDHAYAVYTHVENFYAPPADEVQGEAPDPPEPSEPDFEAMEDNLLSAFDEGIERTKGWQQYDDPAAREYGNIHGVGSRKGARGPGNLLRAYKLEASEHYGDEEVLERALANFDYHCRYQGYRGTLEVFWGKRQWIGGPERRGIGGGLPGFMATYLGRSFMEAIPVFEEQPELLEEQIDANADGEANTTRREAYTRFWRDYLWENMLPRFATAQKVLNQIIVNGMSMMLANEILKFLSPEDAAPDRIILEQMRSKVGLLPIDDDVIDFQMELQTRNPGEYGQAPGSLEEGRYYESKHWNWTTSRHYHTVTPKGIGSEFGYDAPYGFNATEHWKWLSELASDQAMDRQYRRFVDGYQHVLYPTLGQTGRRWQGVGAISARNPGAGWRPISVPGHRATILGYFYAAREFDHEPAKRIVREHFRYHDDFENWGYSNSSQVSQAYQVLQELPSLAEWWQETAPTDYRLPAEREGTYAWVDEMAGLSMITDASGTHYLNDWSTASNSQSSWRPGRPTYHRITDEYRAFGDAKTDFSPASHVATATIGPFDVAINTSNHRDVRVTGGPRAHVPSSDADGLIDVITGTAVDPTTDQILEPNQSMVLDRRRQADPDAGAQPTLTSQSVDDATRRVHWEWDVPEDCEAPVHSLPLGDGTATDDVARYYEDAVTLGTGQHGNQVPNFYRPEAIGDRNPVTATTAGGRSLAVENIDGWTNRLLVERTDPGENTVQATGLLPSFDSYDAWTVEQTDIPTATVSTDDALEVRIADAQEVEEPVPFTFTLPLAAPVERILFTHENGWDTSSSLRTVLQADDGTVLWRGTRPEDVTTPKQWNYPEPTDEMVALEGKHVEDALHFRVVNTAPSDPGEDRWYREMTAGGLAPTTGETTAVDAGWFRRIRDVRIEYEDGTATYPHR